LGFIGKTNVFVRNEHYMNIVEISTIYVVRMVTSGCNRFAFTNRPHANSL